MNDNIRSILEAVEQFDRTAEGCELELRLSLAEIILRGLRTRGWSQRKLAERAKVKESFVSRVVHGDANCTLSTATKLLFALGVRVRLDEVCTVAVGGNAAPRTLMLSRQEQTHGTTFSQTISAASSDPRLRIAAQIG